MSEPNAAQIKVADSTSDASNTFSNIACGTLVIRDLVGINASLLILLPPPTEDVDPLILATSDSVWHLQRLAKTIHLHWEGKWSLNGVRRAAYKVSLAGGTIMDMETIERVATVGTTAG